MVEAVDRVTKAALVTLVAAMTGIVTMQIVLRYVFGSPFAWGEEVTRYMFIYLIFLAAASGVRHGVHVSIDALVNRLPPRAETLAEYLVKAVLTGFLLYLTVTGWQLSSSLMNQSSPALGIPIGYAYRAIPIGSLLALFFLLAPAPEGPAQPIQEDLL